MGVEFVHLLRYFICSAGAMLETDGGQVTEDGLWTILYT